MNIYIKNSRIIRTHDIIKGTLHIRDGKIQALGKVKIHSKKSADIKIIDAKNNYVSPGFIDLHIHGEPLEIERTQKKHGTTGFLMGFHGKDINRLKRLTLKQSSMCLGVFCEGPFINPQMRGAIPKSAISPVDLKLCKELLKTAGIKLMTVAPELKNIEKLISLLKKNKATPSIGHTNATYEQTKKAVDLGAVHATHFLNRMSNITARDPGAVGAVLSDERVKAEVILDGLHMHAENFRMILKCKGVEGVVLITDNVTCYPMPGSMLTKRGFRLKDTNALAGSTLTMNKAVANAIKFANVSIREAVQMASLNPAKVMGLDKIKGSIEKGKHADIVIFDDKFKVKMTMVKGEIIWPST